MLEMYNKKEVLDALKENDWKIINNHNGDVERIAAVAEFVGEKMELSPLYDDTPYQSLNPLRVDRNRLIHVCTSSIAGVIRGFDYRNAIYSVNEYNNSLSIERMKIKKVIFANGEEINFDIIKEEN